MVQDWSYLFLLYPISQASEILNMFSFIHPQTKDDIKDIIGPETMTLKTKDWPDNSPVLKTGHCKRAIQMLGEATNGRVC